MEALDKIIELAGGRSALAQKLNIDRSNITHWETRGGIPARRVLQLSEMFGIPVSEFKIDFDKRSRT